LGITEPSLDPLPINCRPKGQGQQIRSVFQRGKDLWIHKEDQLQYVLNPVEA
jgi:hypothetical protein